MSNESFRLDVWKSLVDGRSLILVRSDIDPWSFIDRASLPWHLRQARLFRRGVWLAELSRSLDLTDLTQQLRNKGFALHAGILRLDV